MYSVIDHLDCNEISKFHTYFTLCVFLLCSSPQRLVSCFLRGNIYYPIIKKVTDYDQEIPQSHTADEPTAPEVEPHNLIIFIIIYSDEKV